jgi:hypothetical protein
MGSNMRTPHCKATDSPLATHTVCIAAARPDIHPMIPRAQILVKILGLPHDSQTLHCILARAPGPHNM